MPFLPARQWLTDKMARLCRSANQDPVRLVAAEACKSGMTPSAVDVGNRVLINRGERREPGIVRKLRTCQHTVPVDHRTSNQSINQAVNDTTLLTNQPANQPIQPNVKYPPLTVNKPRNRRPYFPRLHMLQDSSPHFTEITNLTHLPKNTKPPQKHPTLFKI